MERVLFAIKLCYIYDRLRDFGLVKSKRSYAMDWLGKGKTYMRDYEHRGRLDARVPRGTIRTLRRRLLTLAAQCPPSIAREITAFVAEIDFHSEIADALSRGKQRF